MLKLVYDLYRVFFARVIFYKFNKFLYGLSLRGLGILNYESDKLSGEEYFIEHHLPTNKSGVVLDVGANIGKYSKLVRKTNKYIDIYAFEPHPVTYQSLARNMISVDVRTYNMGIGAKEGSLTLYDYAEEDGSSHASLYKDVIEKIHRKSSVAHEISIISLDNFVADNKIDGVSLLKIDTEGHELEVLKGFERNIRSNKVKLIHFEFNEMNMVSKVCFKDFWDLLPNYDFFRMLPDGLVPIENYSPVFCEIYAYQNIVAKLKPEFEKIRTEIGELKTQA